MQMHEVQKAYPIECKMQDCGTQLWQAKDRQCTVRTKTERDMEMHIGRNHTVEGIGRKFQSETQLAKFLDARGIAYDRDWTNAIKFKGCENIEGGKSSARPDFYLPEESARLNAVVLIGNDEHGHRQYACDLQRLWNLCNALEQDEHFRGVPILYIRFNPHHYTRDGIYYSHSLKVGHELVLSTLHSIQSVRPGVNLVYIHYDHIGSQLNVFNTDDNDFAKIYEDCILLDI